jgi:ABC-type phosphate transport system ATPase subunit
MVFKTKPISKTIYENVAYGLRMELPIKMKLKSALLLQQVALWDEVKDKLKNQLLNFLEVNNNGYVLPVLSQLSLLFY